MDKALQREQTRERVKRYREKAKSVTSGSITDDSVTSIESVTCSLIESLVAPGKRKKLQAVCDAFAKSNHPEYGQDTRFGLDGPTIDILALLLDTTKAIPATS